MNGVQTKTLPDLVSQLSFRKTLFQSGLILSGIAFFTFASNNDGCYFLYRNECNRLPVAEYRSILTLLFFASTIAKLSSSA